MDPFEVRMQFLTLLHRLNASQQSIQKVVAYALKYFSRCGDLIWDCIVEECQKGSLNTRINILYLLDSLCEASLLSKASSGSGSTASSASGGNLYVDFVSRDLATIVDYVVPLGREGLINLMSAIQILENWRNKRIIEPQKIEDVLFKIEAQKAEMHAAATAQETSGENTIESLTFSRNEIFKRIEEDRERHKRLRERRWVQPLVHGPQNVPMLAAFAPLPPEKEPTPSTSPANSAAQTSSDAPNDSAKASETREAGPSSTSNSIPNAQNAKLAPDLPLDIEFDNAWETTSDWNEDDDDAVAEENALCYPNAATRYNFDGEEGKEPPDAGSAVAMEEYPFNFGPVTTFPATSSLVSQLGPVAGPASSSDSMARYSASAHSDPPLIPATAMHLQQQPVQSGGKPSFKVDRNRVNAFGERRGT